MKRTILCFLALVAFLAQAKDVSLPQSRVDVEAAVSRLWSARAFDQLDALEVQLRTSKKLSASGWPLVDLLYQSLDTEITDDMSDEQLSSLARTLDAWVARAADSQLARCAKAKEFRARAWRARGHGYANTVSETQWKEFNKWTSASSRYLVQNEKLLKENPCWYSEMLAIAQLSSSDETEYRQVLKLAWQHFPSDPIFFLDPINHYTPKWGGSVEAMNSFIAESTARLIPGLADEMYARQYSYAIENGLFPNIASAQIDCRRWMRGYDTLSTRFPTEYTFNSAALAAAVCRDQAHAKSYFARFATSPHPEIWMQAFGSADAFETNRNWANSAR